MLPNWLRSVRRYLGLRSTATRPVCRRAPRRRFMLSALDRLECLEDRIVPSGLTLNPATLPADTINVAYANQTISATGGTGNTTLAVNVTNAIAGLSITGNGTSSISISGTPTAVGTESFTVTGTDAADDTTGPVSYSITVNPAVTLSSTTQAVFVTSYGTNAVYEFDANTGALLQTLVAPNSQSILASPAAITVGPDGNLYITGESAQNPNIVEYNFSTGTLSTFITGAQMEAANGGVPFAPGGIAFGPDGNLYTDNTLPGAGADQVIRFDIANQGGQLSYSGTSTTIATGLTNACDITFGVNPGDQGNLYCSDGTSVLKITGATTASPTSSTFTGSTGSSPPLQDSCGLVWQGGNLYDTDAVGNQVLEYSGTGIFIKVFTSSALQGLTPINTLFLADGDAVISTYGSGTANNALMEFNSSGTFVKVLNAAGALPANQTNGLAYMTFDQTAPAAESTVVLAQDTVGASYNQSITPNGGTGAVTLSVGNVENAIPGLSITGNGTSSLSVTGTPTATGTESFTVTATDSVGGTTTTNYTFTVNPAVTLSSTTQAVFVTSYGTNAVYEFDANTGALLQTLVAPNSQSILASPAAITVGPDGNLYITGESAQNPNIVEYNFSTGTLSTFITGAQMEAANGGVPFAPGGIAFGPDGNLYTDNTLPGAGADQVIRFDIANQGGQLSYSGTSTTIATGLTNACDITFGVNPGDQGNLYCSDGTSVLKITGATTASPTSSTFTGSTGSSPPLQDSCGLVWQGGNLYDTDAVGNQVLEYSGTGIFIKVFTSSALQGLTPINTLFLPNGDAVISTYGSGTANNALMEFNSSGTFVKVLNAAGALPANQTNGLAYMTFDQTAPAAESTVVLAQDTVGASYNQSITPNGGTGAVTLGVSNVENAIPGLSITGNGTSSLSVTGTPTATGTETFTVTATDSVGGTTTTNYTFTVNPAVTLSSTTQAVFVTSYGTNAVYEFDANTGALLQTLVAPNSQSILASPAAITVGPDGNLYITGESAQNPNIVEYNFSTGTLSTFITGAQMEAANGGVPFAPGGIAFGPDGNLYTDNTLPGAGADQVIRFDIANQGGQLSYSGTSTTIATGLTNACDITFGVNPGDQGNLYCSDGTSVLKITGATTASPTSSTFTGSTGSSPPLQDSCGLVWQGGNLYDTDAVGNQVLEYSGTGIFIKVFTSSALQGLTPINTLFLADGDAVISTYGSGTANNALMEFNSSGTFVKVLNAAGALPANQTNGLAYMTFDQTAPAAESTVVLAQDTVGASYNQSITPNGGTGAVTLGVGNVENAIPGLSITGNGTSSLSVTGTPTATGTESFTVTATDSVGGTTTTNYTFTVNAAPTLSPGSLLADIINVAYNQSISASGGTGAISLTTHVTNTVAGLSVPSSGSGSIAITGTPTAAGTEAFTVTATDAAGGTTTTNYSVIVNPAVTHANLPAVQFPGPQSVLDNTTLVFSTATGNAITVSDTGASAGTVETLFLQDFYGTLLVANTAGLSSITGNGTALVTMTGTLTALNAALNGLRYAPPPFTYNFAEPLSATLVAPDNSIASGSTALNVTFASRAPTVPGLQTVLSTGTLTFSSANGNGITVADPVAGSTDVETVYVQTLWGTLHVSTVGANTSISGNDTSLVTLSGPLTQINAALNGLLYTPAAFTYSYSDTLDVLQAAKDGPVTSAVAISVQHVNLPPTATLPSTQAVNSGATLAFSTANGNAISVGDPDANGGIETVTLQATAGSGSLTLHSTAGLSLVSGNGSTLIGLKGTVAQLNAALGQLSFTAAGSFQGTAWLSVLIDDNGDNGASSALSASGSIAITVSTVVTPPVVTISGPTTQAIVGTGLVAIAPAISVSDPTANGAIATLMVQAMTGSLTVTSTSGLTSATGVGTKSLTLEGTIAALNTALQSLEYQAVTGATTDFISVMVAVPNGTATAAATLGISLTITPNAVPGG